MILLFFVQVDVCHGLEASFLILFAQAVAAQRDEQLKFRESAQVVGVHVGPGNKAARPPLS